MAKEGQPGTGARGRAGPSHKGRDWIKMQLSLPGEGKSRSDIASRHNDDDLCLGEGAAHPQNHYANQHTPKGGESTPARYECNENPAAYNHPVRPDLGCAPWP